MRAGDGHGDAFQPLTDSQELSLQFASQAAMGLPVVIETSGIDPRLEQAIAAQVLVDNAPIGSWSSGVDALVCAEGKGYVDAMIMIDVTSHPTVTSAAQLDNRAAVLVLEVGSDSNPDAGAVAEAFMQVTLRL